MPYIPCKGRDLFANIQIWCHRTEKPHIRYTEPRLQFRGMRPKQINVFLCTLHSTCDTFCFRLQRYNDLLKYANSILVSYIFCKGIGVGVLVVGGEGLLADALPNGGVYRGEERVGIVPCMVDMGNVEFVHNR